MTDMLLASLSHVALLPGRPLSSDTPQSTLIRLLDTMTAAFVIAPWLLWLPVWLGLRGEPSTGLAGLLGMLTLFSAAAVVVHRTAALAAGLTAGARLVRVHLGPLRVDRVSGEAGDGWRATSGPWMVGWSLIPASPRLVRSTVFTAAAAGPLVNFTAGLLSADLFLLRAAEPGLVPAWLALFSAALLGNVVSSLIPLSFRGFHTDGAILQGLIQGSERMSQLTAIETAVTSLTRATRPRDWSAALATRLTLLDDESPEYFNGQYLAYLRALDLGDPRLAHFHLTEIVDQHSGDGFPPVFSVEIAYFQARWRNRPDSARQWLLGCNGGQGAPEALVNRALAAVHLAESNAAGARFCVNRVDSLCPAPAESGFALLERDLLDDLSVRIPPFLLEPPAVEITAPAAAEALPAAAPEAATADAFEGSLAGLPTPTTN